jgi:hypothetical protein
MSGLYKEGSIPVTIIEGLADAQARPLNETLALDNNTKTWVNNHGISSPRAPGIISMQKNTGTPIPTLSGGAIQLCTIDVPRAALVLLMPEEYVTVATDSVWVEIYTRDPFVNDGLLYHEDGSNGLSNMYSDWTEALVVNITAPARLYVLVYATNDISIPLSLRWSYATAADYLIDASAQSAAAAERAALQQSVWAAQDALAASQASLNTAQSDLTTANINAAQALSDAVAAQAASDAGALVGALARLATAEAARNLATSDLALRATELATANTNLTTRTAELAVANAQLALVQGRIDAAVAAQLATDRTLIDQVVADKNTAVGALATMTAAEAIHTADMNEYVRQVRLTGEALRSLVVSGDGATPAEVAAYSGQISFELGARNLALSDLRGALGFVGAGSIHGMLYNNNVGTARVVRLYSQASGELVSTSFSAIDGAFSFSGVSAGDYYVTAHDFGKVIDTVICKNVVV